VLDDIDARRVPVEAVGSDLRGEEEEAREEEPAISAWL
jgi:hypothetical protein